MSDLDEHRARARAAREALVGTTIAGRYILRSLIGHGGMGAVYEAEHMGLGKRVAVKFVDPEFATDERVVARFAREARAMSAIESAHIVSVIDAGTEGGRPFLVMELLRGEDLGQRLRRERRVPVRDAMHVVAQVLKGLARAHGAGIVHRDLKPDNVFLAKSDTDPLFAKIVDFGISKIERPRNKTTPLALTGRGTVLGTPFYMSPEQAQAAPDVDGRADLYSVGAILFECLSGRPPHTGESYEQVILSICMRDAPDLRAIDPKVPADVSAFVARALARDRAQRFTSAERMLAALHDVAPEEKTRVPLDPGPPETLISAGVLPASRASASSPISAATRLGVATLSPAPEPKPQSQPQPQPRLPSKPDAEPAASAPAPPPASARPARRSALVVATAIGATLTGVAATLALIGALDKKPQTATARTTSHATTHATTSHVVPSPSVTASASASASAATVASEAPAVAPSAAPSTTKPSTKSAPPRTAPSTGGTKLDIQRELP